MSEDTEPLYAGAIDGVRIWRLVNGPPRLLGSTVANQVWPPGEPMQASCLAHAFETETGFAHLAPDKDCSCGLYALHPHWRGAVVRVEKALAGPLEAVPGTISAWGRIEVHLAGFRAERARPSILFVRGTGWKAAITRRLAETYGAEVVDVPDRDALRSYFKSELRGISPSAARDLIVDGLRLRLFPSMEGFSGNSNELVAASGFRLEPDTAIATASAGVRLPGLSLFAVSGVGEHSDALQDEAFAPGSPVALVPERSEISTAEDDRSIGVWNSDRTLKVGYVDGRQSRRLAWELRRGRIKAAFVVWQYRGMDTGRRSGIRVLTSPTERVAFVPPAEGQVVWLNNDDIPF